jgi:hypothetical protein
MPPRSCRCLTGCGRARYCACLSRGAGCGADCGCVGCVNGGAARMDDDDGDDDCAPWVGGPFALPPPPPPPPRAAGEPESDAASARSRAAAASPRKRLRDTATGDAVRAAFYAAHAALGVTDADAEATPARWSALLRESSFKTPPPGACACCCCCICAGEGKTRVA